jgi:DTW domain-containing protein YfiP
VHAAVLCPAQVAIHNFPADLDRCVAEWGDADTTVLLFPSADATPVRALSAAQLARVRRAVFIDSTWQQARSIWNDPRVAAWPKVAIESQRTRFWRYHELGDHCLSTIEAIYHLCREWHTRETGAYAGLVNGLYFSNNHCFLFFFFQITKTIELFLYLFGKLRRRV